MQNASNFREFPEVAVKLICQSSFFLSVCLSLYPSISACLSLTYALCLVFPVSLALSHSCSISHLYKEPGAHSSGHSDESVWMKGRSHRPELMLLLHIRNVWNADRLHTVECRTLWCSFAVILCGSDALSSDSQIVCTAVLRSGKKLYYRTITVTATADTVTIITTCPWLLTYCWRMAFSTVHNFAKAKQSPLIQSSLIQYQLKHI